MPNDRLQSKEATKLAQRIALAEEQFDQGLRKLTAASKQLASLKRQVRCWPLLRHPAGAFPIRGMADHGGHDCFFSKTSLIPQTSGPVMCPSPDTSLTCTRLPSF